MKLRAVTEQVIKGPKNSGGWMCFELEGQKKGNNCTDGNMLSIPSRKWTNTVSDEPVTVTNLYSIYKCLVSSLLGLCIFIFLFLSCLRFFTIWIRVKIL